LGDSGIIAYSTIFTGVQTWQLSTDAQHRAVSPWSNSAAIFEEQHKETKGTKFHDTDNPESSEEVNQHKSSIS
jgi:hypothetical protein